MKYTKIGERTSRRFDRAIHQKQVRARTTRPDLVRQNLRIVKQLYPALPQACLTALRELTQGLHLSVSQGQILCINGKWYVTHSGLLAIALRRRCHGIRTCLQERLSDPLAGRWIFKAVVYKRSDSKGFVGYGDADPLNVGSLVRGAEMRVAETRAVNRALRKAYGIGLCSVEELGSLSGSPTATVGSAQPHRFHAAGPSTNGHHPRLRDQLCLLIRQHSLDPTLVKAYAADFCGTQTLKDASRDLVESFISHIGTAAKEDRDSLVCKLNSFARPKEPNL
jgi:hypothetical protein